MGEKPPSYNDATEAPRHPQPGYPQPGYPQPGYPQYGPPPQQQQPYPPYGTAPPPTSVPPGTYPTGPPPPQQIIITSNTSDPFRSGFWRQQPNVVLTNNGATVLLGPGGTIVTCPSCRHQITTVVQSTPTTKTHLFALLMCLFGCWPCCLLPYCMDDCQGRSHSCPNCGAFLGIHEM